MKFLILCERERSPQNVHRGTFTAERSLYRLLRFITAADDTSLKLPLLPGDGGYASGCRGNVMSA